MTEQHCSNLSDAVPSWFFDAVIARAKQGFSDVPCDKLCPDERTAIEGLGFHVIFTGFKEPGGQATYDITW